MTTSRSVCEIGGMLRGVVMRRDVPVLSDPAVGLRPAPARGNDVSNPYVARHTFTKLVVGDLEGMARYYASVFGLTEIARVQAEVDGAPIDEIILGFEGAFAGGLILFTFVGRPAPQPGEVIVGFTTDDIHALFDREWERDLSDNPLAATYLGDPRFDDRLPDISPAIGRRDASQREDSTESSATPHSAHSTQRRKPGCRREKRAREPRPTAEFFIKVTCFSSRNFPAKKVQKPNSFEPPTTDHRPLTTATCADSTPRANTFLQPA